ncbi:Sucrase/ferredoxin-like-domain-containing protein [Dichotomocladium elegans]|nr:Sucrase/ferredoxin-like-domain-containing protein [Dichotomocladium elegans]
MTEEGVVDDGHSEDAAFSRRRLGRLIGRGAAILLIPPEDRLVSDCASCPSPCDDHKPYPSMTLDHTTPLLGSMKPYGRHIMIGTGQSDWASHIEDEKGTLAAKLHSIIKEQFKEDWRNIVTNTSLLTLYSTKEKGHDVIILPDNIMVSDVTPDNAQAFFDEFVNQPLPDSADMPMKESKTMKVRASPYTSMVLICSHKKRDKRCGIVAPILSAEFEHVLREKDMSEDDVGIFMVSHIGGHKFAGNVICYINEGRTGIWYGRVNTCHCKSIIEDTICKGKVIKELYRGAMTHSFTRPRSDRVKW